MPAKPAKPSDPQLSTIWPQLWIAPKPRCEALLGGLLAQGTAEAAALVGRVSQMFGFRDFRGVFRGLGWPLPACPHAWPYPLYVNQAHSVRTPSGGGEVRVSILL